MESHHAHLPIARLSSIDGLHDEKYSIYEDEDELSVLTFFMYPRVLRRIGGVITNNVVSRLIQLSSPSPITSLDCHVLYEWKLEPLLCRLSNMHTLSLQPGIGEMLMFFSRETLYKALGKVKSTIRSLTITSANSPRITVDDTFVSFATLDKLETLNFPRRLLVPLDLADPKPAPPPNVRHLTISNSFRGDVDGESEFAGYHLVEDILTNWRTKTPQLESVVIEDNDSWYERDKRELQAEAYESGMKVTWAFLDVKSKVND